MDITTASKILDKGLSLGFDYTEIFVEETRSSSVSLSDGKVETASAGTEFGIGLRLISGTEVLYASTSREDEDHLISLLVSLSKLQIGRAHV